MKKYVLSPQLMVALFMLASLTFLMVYCQPRPKNDRPADILMGPDIPTDVNTGAVARLTQEGKFAHVQRIFDVFSWQSFIALSWPRNEAGQPQPNIGDHGPALWERWKESYEVFKSDGGKPAPWGEKDLPDAVSELLPDGAERVLFRTSKFSHFHTEEQVADEIDQAFTAPIWDQNGNVVRYEILINETEFDYIVQNQLYNLDGQIAFSKDNLLVAFPSSTADQVGAMEVKLAWKVMVDGVDDPGRYFVREAYILNEDRRTFSKAQLGLVGMHISQKTASAPQWIWSTFEHVDNLEVNELEEVDGKPLKASFYDSECQTCPINVFPDTSAEVIRNQIQRVLPIPKALQQLNSQFQTLLADQGSVLQYYQLIGTQWPTDPSAPPYPVLMPSDTTTRQLPQAVANKAGGNPTPVWLTNMIMETYFQGATDINSTATFNYLIANEPAWLQIEGMPKDGGNFTKIFGTESCVGCHASASIAIRDTIENGERKAIFAQRYDPKYKSMPIADFSWLLQLKAKFAAQ